MVDYKVMNENGNNVPMYSPPLSSESIHQEETSSDEGWQEANSKGRSRNTANHKLGRKGSHLSKLRTTVIRESPQKSSSRVLSKVFSPSRQSEPENLAFIEDSAGQLSPTKPTRVSKSFASLTPYDTFMSSGTNFSFLFNKITKELNYNHIINKKYTHEDKQGQGFVNLALRASLIGKFVNICFNFLSPFSSFLIAYFLSNDKLIIFGSNCIRPWKLI
ncbi:hypothetical protein AHAS_Ahas20G0161700 [Arachis hypogaea]